MLTRGPSPGRFEQHGDWPSAVVDPSVVDSFTLRARVLAGGTATATGEGIATEEVRDGHPVEVDVTGEQSGDRWFTLRQCNPLNATACSTFTTEVQIRERPDLYVATGGPLGLSQNGDGLWETEIAHVQLDYDVPVSARWWIVGPRGGAVMGPVDLGPEQVAEGRGLGTRVVIDPRAELGRPLPAGHYRFVVESTSLVPGFAKTARQSFPLAVSDARPLKALEPDTPVFYPDAGSESGVPDAVRFQLDRYEITFGGFDYRVLRKDGTPLADPDQWFLGPSDPAIVWAGQYWDGKWRQAPAGTYRIEVRRTEHQPGTTRQVTGLVSAPFRLRNGMPAAVDATSRGSARATWRGTRRRDGASVRPGSGGALHIERRRGRRGVGWTTTLHTLRLAPDRDLSEYRIRVRLHGEWERLRHVTTMVALNHRGQEREVGTVVSRSRRRLVWEVPERLVRPDGRLRLRIRWKVLEPARLDGIVAAYRRYPIGR